MMGHVSARTPDGNRFLLRHIRPPIDPNVPEDDVLEFDLTGKRHSGLREAGGPGFEIHFFTGPYNANKEIGGVVHCHPPMALALIAAGQKVIGLTHRHKFDEVPVVPWVYGSLPEHGEIVTKALAVKKVLPGFGHRVHTHDPRTPLRRPSDLAHHVLLHLDDPEGRMPWLDWRAWLAANGEPTLSR